MKKLLLLLTVALTLFGCNQNAAQVEEEPKSTIDSKINCSALEDYRNTEFFDDMASTLELELYTDNDEKLFAYYRPKTIEKFADTFIINEACYSEDLNTLIMIASYRELGNGAIQILKYDIGENRYSSSNQLAASTSPKFGDVTKENITLFGDTCDHPEILRCIKEKYNYNIKTGSLKIIFEDWELSEDERLEKGLPTKWWRIRP